MSLASVAKLATMWIEIKNREKETNRYIKYVGS